MGYCVRATAAKVQFKPRRTQEALTAIKSLIGKETIRDSYGSHFSWVDDFTNASSLKEALEAWRWDAEENPYAGTCKLNYFTGEKYGDDEILFKVLAPFIEAGSTIEWRGEDGEHWRFVFDGVAMRIQRGKIIWEDE